MSSTHPSGDETADDDEGDVVWGLISEGVGAVVDEHRSFDFEGNQPSAVGGATRMLEACVEYLQVRGEVHRRDLVDAIYQPAGDHPIPEQGLYVRLQGGEWFDDVGAPQLRRFPCVEAVDDGDRWRFDLSGVDPEALDDEHVAPLEEIRTNSALAAKAKLDDLGVERRTDERVALRQFWKRIRIKGLVPVDELDRAGQGTGVSPEDVAGTLKRLPGIERTVEEPPAPEEIAIETMADVLDGYERLKADPVEVWRYDSPCQGGE